MVIYKTGNLTFEPPIFDLTSRTFQSQNYTQWRYSRV